MCPLYKDIETMWLIYKDHNKNSTVTLISFIRYDIDKTSHFTNFVWETN